MIRLRNISLYKIILAYMVTILYPKPMICLALFLYLLLDDYVNGIVYVFLVLWLFSYRHFSFNLNLFLLKLNDINPIYKYLLERTESFSNPAKSALKQVLFNVYDVSNEYHLGYGLLSYSLVRYINRITDNGRYLIMVIVILLILMFGWQDKYLLVIIPLILSFTRIEKSKARLITILTVLLINPDFLSLKQFYISFIFQLSAYFDLGLKFKSLLITVQSILFSQISFVTLIKPETIMYVKMITYIICIFILFLNPSANISAFIFKAIDTVNRIIEIGIRGKLSLFNIAVVFLLIKRFKVKRETWQCTLIIICLLLPFNQMMNQITFIDVGQGDSALIKLRYNRGNALIDTGSSFNYQKLKRYLFSEGIYVIDYLIITHDDEDHNGNVSSLKKDFIIRKEIHKGQDIQLKKFKLKFYDLGIFDSDNDNSLVYGISMNELNFLFTGDISRTAEAVYVNKYGYEKTDVLKVSHHGSYTGSGTYFISNLRPSYAVISTNGKYNHPHVSTLNTLNRYLCKILVTKEEGNIEFHLSDVFRYLKTDRDFVIIR